MIRFIRFFIAKWAEYPYFIAFCDARPQLMAEAKARGDYMYKSRFDFAWSNAKLCCKHSKEDKHVL
ncbi:MAG: hypothetical protein IKZ82_10820 [Clostridia bacterium]|nr:hypothetical protein [Clostridia bacterium]